MNNARIFEEFSHKLILFFNKRVQQPEDAKDLVQEVFLKIVKHNGKEPAIKNIGGWVFTVANNTLIDYYRKNKIKYFEIEEGLDQAETDADKKLEEQLIDCLKLFLQQLDPETKAIMEWVEFNKGSQKELADRLGMPYPTLRSRVQRGRKKILKLFHESCNMSFDSRGGIAHCQTKNKPNPCSFKC